MTGMTNSTQLRNRDTGKPGNDGRFDGHARTAADITLDGLTLDAFNEQFAAEFAFVGSGAGHVPSRIVVDGDEVTIEETGNKTYGDGRAAGFIASTADDEVEVHVYEWNIDNAEASISAAVIAKRAARLGTQKKNLPVEAHSAIDQEIARIEALQPLLGGDWGYGEQITLASGLTGRSFTSEDQAYLVPEGAEFLYVGEKALVYDAHLRHDFLAALVNGESAPDEEDEEQWNRYWGLYENRLDKDGLDKVAEYFKTEYDLEFEDSFEIGSPLTLHRFVPTEVDGRPVTLEWARDEVETGFSNFQRDLEHGVLEQEIYDLIAYDREPDTGK